jgi:hypothetical protein
MERPTRLRSPRIGVLVALFLTAAMGLVLARATLGAQVMLQEPPDIAGGRRHQQDAGNVPQSPTISFIESPSPTCYRPIPGTGACYIQWSYLHVTAGSGAYVISMTVAIDGHVRAYSSGFFQTSMTIPGTMTGPGFGVTCGTEGSGGTPGWGRTYAYTIRARDTGGLSSANYGTVTCPADTVRIFLPLSLKHS